MHPQDLSSLKPGCSVCLDAGPTIQQLVEMIPEDLPLSVITPSLTAALSLSSKKDVQVLLPGGFLHHSNRTLLLDYSKWNVSSICNSITLEHLDLIITDSKAPEKSVREAAEPGKEILIQVRHRRT